MDLLVKNVKIPSDSQIWIRVYSDGSACCYDEDGNSYSTYVHEVNIEED